MGLTQESADEDLWHGDVDGAEGLAAELRELVHEGTEQQKARQRRRPDRVA
jgi:hypothetical protein